MAVLGLATASWWLECRRCGIAKGVSRKYWGSQSLCIGPLVVASSSGIWMVAFPLSCLLVVAVDHIMIAY